MRQELLRQFVHFLFGSAFIALVVLAGVNQSLFVLVGMTLLGLVVSFLIRQGLRVPLLHNIMQIVERNYEKTLPGKGAFMFFLGAIVLMFFFKEQAVVVGALCVAVYGDAASTIFGIKFGKHKLTGKKTLEGTLGGILVSLLFLGVLFEWWVALIAAGVGMLAELLPIDDNLTIPIVTAVVLTLLL
jgi:dolichol kinase